MIPSREQLEAWLSEHNMLAFLAVIRRGEGTADALGYRRHFGGHLFETFEDHPRKVFSAGQYRSSAAGAYQILERTWNDLVERHGFGDFAPHTQDLAAVALIWRRGAIEDVLAGRLDEAIAKCAKEWASLPGAPYGQPTISKAVALATFLDRGGRLGAEQAPAPVEEIAITRAGEPAPAVEELPMTPFIAAALPAVLGAVPELVKIFGNKATPVAERNAAAAVKVVEIAQQALGADNAQAVSERLATDPQAAAEVRSAIRARWYDLAELGGGIEAARAHELRVAEAGIAPWRLPAVWATVALLPLVYLVVSAVVFQVGGTWSEEVRAMVVSAVVAGVLGAITGYWLGTSASSARKTDLMAGRA